MSASGIQDEIVSQLGASGFFGIDCSKSYGVLESSNASCVVVDLQGGTWQEQTFDHDSEWIWTYSLRGFSKDTGDAGQVLGRTISIIDTVASAVRSDPTFNGKVNRVRSLEIDRELPPGGFFVAGGGTWQEVRMNLVVEEWPGETGASVSLGG